MVQIAPAKLEDVATAILVAAGSAELEAREVARHLVGANLKGHDSHGVSMLVEYVTNVQAGFLHPNRHARIVTEFGAIAVFDGDMGYGQITAREATEWGIAKAKSEGLAAVALRNTHHIARVGTYGELAAAAKDAAAQAKSTVEDANNPVAPSIVPSPSQSAVPLAVAVALSLLAMLLIRQLRRR